jgi:hypothetical protein
MFRVQRPQQTTLRRSAILLLLIIAGIIAIAIVVATHTTSSAGSGLPAVQPRPTARATAAKISAVQEPTTPSTSQLLAADVSGSSKTLNQERADFRTFYAHFSGLEKECDDAAIAAYEELATAFKHSNQLSNAFEAAKTADDACSDAVADMTEQRPPRSLTAFRLPDLIHTSSARLSTARDEWRAAAQILHAERVDLLTPAKLQKYIKIERAYSGTEATDLAPVIATLHVSLKNIVPIVPSS